ncbi:MAG: 4Fe-4S binding protein [Deltaproteobacteria bacterium]|nr:4Fe-4S binding protein [Deltaproteobacteria bacterium]MBW2035780.1 4Fe-4S binding protein [Deltaproteobacteria bacterium]MBW2169746.1 4Fe-4S binding protein [Deltaproteobacteria bacterium]
MSAPKKRTQYKAGKAKVAGNTKTTRRKKTRKPKELYDQIIFRDWCKACGICSAFCPKNVIGRDESGAPVIEHPDDCIGCLFCEIHCPDFAITIKKRHPESKRKSS